MWWLSFMKLREILVGIIIGLFLAILFWSGDQYATEPKTRSDSGEFNLHVAAGIGKQKFSRFVLNCQRGSSHASQTNKAATTALRDT